MTADRVTWLLRTPPRASLYYLFWRSRTDGVGRPRRTGPRRLILTCDVDGPEFLVGEDAVARRESYFSVCAGRVAEMVVYLTSRTLDGERVADLADRIRGFREHAGAHGIRVLIESHGSAHVRLDRGSLRAQIENIRDSVADLEAAGERPTEFRAPYLSHDRRTPWACRRAGLAGPVGTNLPSDFRLIETLDAGREEGIRLIRECCRGEVAAGRDLMVLYHFNSFHDPRAPVFLEAYLDAAESLLGPRG